jgi:hypothetical protein
VRDGGARAEKRRLEIDVEDAVPGALVRVVERGRGINRRHVEEHVEAAQVCRRTIDERDGLRSLRQVSLTQERPASGRSD